MNALLPNVFTDERVKRIITVERSGCDALQLPSPSATAGYWHTFCENVRTPKYNCRLSLTLVDRQTNLAPRLRDFRVANVDALFLPSEQLTQIVLRPIGRPRVITTQKPLTFHANATLTLHLSCPVLDESEIPPSRELTVPAGVHLKLSDGTIHLST